jgi:hypothetical protein
MFTVPPIIATPVFAMQVKLSLSQSTCAVREFEEGDFPLITQFDGGYQPQRPLAAS